MWYLMYSIFALCYCIAAFHSGTLFYCFLLMHLIGKKSPFCNAFSFEEVTGTMLVIVTIDTSLSIVVKKKRKERNWEGIVPREQVEGLDEDNRLAIISVNSVVGKEL